jgi:hypothetical protein
MQAHYSENEIKSLLQKVRIFNKGIGTYEMFAITENFDYVVKLSNGRILLKPEDLQDDERDVLTPERLIVIAGRFVSVYTQASDDKQNNTAGSQSPPVFNEKPPKKKRKTGLIILLIIFAVAILIIGGLFVADSFSDSGISDDIFDTYNERVKSVDEIERENPLRFLSASGDYKENFWGDKIKVNCTIYNSATVVTYKDVVVRITYYTKSDTSIGSENYTIYEVFPPNSGKTIKLKINNYTNTSYINWEVVSADVY